MWCTMVVLVVEKLRLYAYANFWFVIFLGIFLTKSFAGLDEDDTLLTQVPVPMCPVPRRLVRATVL